MALRDVEPEIFAIFVDWLYKQQLPSSMRDLIYLAEPVATYRGNMIKRSELYLLKACAFGERFHALLFKHDAHNLYINWKGQQPSFYESIIWAFENLREQLPVLDFMVDAQCLLWDPYDDGDGEIALRDQLPQEFLLRVMMRSHGLRSWTQGPRQLNLCSYHLHRTLAEQDVCPSGTTGRRHSRQASPSRLYQSRRRTYT
tara:strand:+ start:2929 stop:3528 length:600 start_codon:yes stop_codon:yes gene_type:complete